MRKTEDLAKARKRRKKEYEKRSKVTNFSSLKITGTTNLNRKQKKM